MALPSRRESMVKRIVSYDGDLAAATYPQSVTVELEDEIDLSRGEMLVEANAEAAALPDVSNRFRAMVVWMHEEPLTVGRTYFAKHTTRTVRATVRKIEYRVDVNSLDQLVSDSIAMNEIAEVEFETNLPLFFDSYKACRWTGSLILIDALSNATVGAAMIIGPVTSGAADEATSPGEARWPALILLPGRAVLAARVQDALIARGVRAVAIDDALFADTDLPVVVRALSLAGVTALSSRVLSQAVIAEIEGFAPGAVRVEESTDEETVLKDLAGTV
jgi:bifunctional enzyme CysN/CysC/sulfate adenylyltransferase subunit 1